MRTTWARGLGLATAVALIAGMTACSGSADKSSQGAVGGGDYTGPKVEVTFWNGWTGGNHPKLVAELVDKFNAEHDNITVKDVPQEWADIASKAPMAIQSGNGPDVAVLHGDDIATYAAQNLLLDASEINKTLGYQAGDFPPGVYDKGMYDSTQYAIPWSVTPLGMYVNKDVVAKAGIKDMPTDKASYVAALDALKAADIQGEWVDSFIFTGTFEFESLVWQHGGDLYNKDVTKATFNSDAGVQALTWMKDMIDKGYSPANVAQDGNLTALASGKAAFNWNGIWQTTNASMADVPWTAVAVPQIGSQKAVWSSSTHWVFPANKNQDKNKTDAAAVFVKWMNDNSTGWLKSGELPAANKIRTAPSVAKDHPQLEAFINELEYAHYETVSPGINEANALITTAISEALTGKKSPKQALDDAASQADQILEKNKAKYGA
ncbi:MAG: ABC transporter substrate-binding protein [Propionibacteriaceae bacterium]|nr:ABC transporter substrate-binding protein [Propionibacteriaceae bacterium]